MSLSSTVAPVGARRLLATGSALAVVLLLSACGGGGGGGPSGPGTVAPPTGPSSPSNGTGGTGGTGGSGGTGSGPTTPPPSAEYTASAGAAAANASYAYDHGITGKGVVIADVDSGIDVNNPEFAGRISKDSMSFPISYADCLTCAPQTVTFDLQDKDGHGTWTADLAAGAKNGSGIQGVAYDATILALKIASADLDTRDANGKPTEGTGVNTTAIAPAISYAMDKGAFVVNLSVNGGATGVYAAQQKAAMDKVRAANGLLVESVSNVNEDSSAAGTIAANLVGSDFSNKAWFLFALRLDANKKPIPGDGTPGVLADRTLAVVASGVQVVGVGGQISVVDGNSFAAPVVAGAAALLKQYWPQLGGKEISQILLDTADDLGAPGVDQIYGVGLLDIARAMQAQAPNIGTSAYSVASSHLIVSTAFGGSKAAAGLATKIGDQVVLDRYGRNFVAPTSAMARAYSPMGLQLHGMLAATPMPSFAAPSGSAYAVGLTGQPVDGRTQASPRGTFAFATSPGTMVTGSIGMGIEDSGLMTGAMLRQAGFATTGSSFAVLTDGYRLSFGTARQGFDGRTSGTQRMAITMPNGLRFGITSSREKGSALGMTGSGAFGIAGASSTFVTGGWEGDLSGFHLTGEAMVGRTSIRSASSIASYGTATSTGFRVQADHRAFGGLASFGLTSPLKVEAALLHYDAPVGYNEDTFTVINQRRNVNLAASAREMDVELGWSKPTAIGAFSLGGAYGMNSGNAAGVASAGAWARFSTSF